MRHIPGLFLSLLFLLAPAISTALVEDTSTTGVHGLVQSVDLANNRITVNDRTYRTRRNVEVSRQTSEGSYSIHPSQLARNMEVRLEQENGVVTRVHVLDPN